MSFCPQGGKWVHFPGKAIEPQADISDCYPFYD